MDKSKIVLLIPSLNPDDKLIQLVKEIKQAEFKNIVIVNDGSKQECLHYFSTLEKEYGCKIFTHFKNLGKGRALKNAFNYILSTFKDFNTVISLDSDGQHKVEDVIKLAQKFENAKPNSLGLGCREFQKKDIPFRSKFGNIFTRLTLKVLCGISVSDTQTGLRAFTKETMKEFMDLPGERFEYEMNMILSTKNKGIEIIEQPIETIYIEDNETSHFNPVKDSVKIISRIFSVFLKYSIVSILSFVIDFALFYLFLNLTKSWVGAGAFIIVSTILARVISSVFNFALNKKTVFKQKQKHPKFFIMYISLVIVNMILSAVLVDVLFKYCGFAELWAKVLVDGTLFVLSFIVQRDIIFNNKISAKKENNAMVSNSETEKNNMATKKRDKKNSKSKK